MNTFEARCVRRVELRRPRDEDRTRRNPHGCRLAYDASSATTFFSLEQEKKGKERTEIGRAGASWHSREYSRCGHSGIGDALDAVTQSVQPCGFLRVRPGDRDRTQVDALDAASSRAPAPAMQSCHGLIRRRAATPC